MKEDMDNTSRGGGPTYAARSLSEYISPPQSTYKCVKG
jgi:hypothetical protein